MMPFIWFGLNEGKVTTQRGEMIGSDQLLLKMFHVLTGSPPKSLINLFIYIMVIQFILHSINKKKVSEPQVVSNQMLKTQIV